MLQNPAPGWRKWGDMKAETSISANAACLWETKQRRNSMKDAGLRRLYARPGDCARLLAYCVMLAVVLLAADRLSAQSTTTGAVFGTVTDPTGAVVSGATATLKSVETGRTSTATTSGNGEYRFSLLQPGRYSVTVSQSGFTSSTVPVEVGVGQVSTANVKLQLKGQSQTVEVSGAAPVLQLDNGNITTTITDTMIANQPNPGNDLTYLAQTAPGAVMNTQNGYGNFSTFGLPGTSNLFTSNGMNDNDPFLNLNNTGATNQMLGTNDARELTVVNNGYSVQYGGLAGSNVNIVTKSGTNQFHGNAEYFYNWDGLNANNWFNNHNGVPRPHAVANLWAASIGGPIRKNKSFFFVDNEGLYLAIPTSTQVPIPSSAFQTATLASIPASEVPFYNKIFNLYNNAPGASRAVPTGTPGVDQFRSTAGNHTHEWILTGRYDQVLGNSSWRSSILTTTRERFSTCKARTAPTPSRGLNAPRAERTTVVIGISNRRLMSSMRWKRSGPETTNQAKDPIQKSRRRLSDLIWRKRTRLGREAVAVPM